MNDAPIPQRVRSFVLRQGRITLAQRRALSGLLPRYGLDAAGGVFNFTDIFGRDAKRTLEIGFGNGDTLLELARAYPDEDFLGIEVHRPGVGRLLNRLADGQLANVRVVCADAVDVLSRCMPDASLDCVVLYFPDPWPKQRHHKRRLVQPEFVGLVARKLKADGRFRLATDWPDYAAHMLAVLSASQDFTRVATDDDAPPPAVRVLTKFERRGMQLGHPVHDLVFVRR
ncbi:MAG: tRNA (guanosine(46)-N7)-methyltransferase TrmB [Gammaproteobacteria bacterium]